jgi:MraZ protein
MFLGTSRHTLDAKGRVSIPAKFRDPLKASEFAITPGLHENLHIYPADTWRKMTEELSETSPFDLAVADLKGDFFGMGEMAKLDGAGRVLIPQNLRELVGLKGDVVIVGAQDHLQVWSADLYDKRERRSMQELFANVAARRQEAK